MLHKLTTALAASMLVAGAASATTLIDTGIPDGSLAGFALDATDFLAVEFDAPTAWRLDSIGAYLVGGNPGDHFAVSLYRDALGLPGDLIASTQVSFVSDGWNQISFLGWHLPAAGSYWLGLEGTVSEAIPGIPVPDGSFIAPAGGLTMPGATAFSDGSYQGYQSDPTIQFGLQVTGAVPEPASVAMMLLGIGLVGVASARASHRQGRTG